MQRTSNFPCTVSRNLNPNLRLSLRLEAGFESLDQVWETSAQWMQEYNEEWPHDALARVPSVLVKSCLRTGPTSVALTFSRDEHSITVRSSVLCGDDDEN